LITCAVIVIAFGSSGIVRFVASVSDFGYLMGLGIVNFAVIALHRRMPNLRRPFKVAFYPWVPMLGVLSCWLFVPALELRSFLLGGGLTIAGTAVYLIRPANRPQAGELANGVARLKLLITARRRRRMRVLIIDGGRQGQNIAKRLLARDEYRLVFRAAEHQITFIEEDEMRCRELERRFNVPIYQGDGSKQEVLEQVGVANVDVAVAASDDDGRNVIVALQAKRLGMPRVMAIVQDPDYLPLLEESGVVAISAPWATAAMVENFLDRPGVAQLFEIGTGVASLVGITVDEDARVAGHHIRDIDFPKQCVVAAVIRGKEFVVPRGDASIEVGDRVIFVGPAPAIKAARDVIQQKT
jgi:Trk K+ transport system NAD-binding subunit